MGNVLNVGNVVLTYFPMTNDEISIIKKVHKEKTE